MQSGCLDKDRSQFATHRKNECVSAAHNSRRSNPRIAKSRPGLSRNTVIVLLFVLALLSISIVKNYIDGSVTEELPDPQTRIAYVESERIFISGNSEFHDKADVEGWAGDGSAASPYLIEDLQIQATVSEAAISVGNTNLYFEIRSCYLWNESETYGIGITLFSVSNATLSDNLLTCSCGISLIECDNVSITDNQFINGTFAGIDAEDSSYVLVSGNICRGLQNAVQVRWSHNMTIEHNELAFNSGCGLHIGGLTHSHIEGNIVNDNSGEGAYVSGLWWTAVTNNEVSRNGAEGFHINEGSFCDITENTFIENTLEGILIAFSTETMIHNNTFMDNNGAGSTYDQDHVQATNADSSIYWNSSTHGNYWSDWQTPDENSDGIVDEPYEIGPFDTMIPDYGATDYMPLTSVPTTPIPEFHSVAFTVVGIALVFAALARTRRRER